jgi:hypothetical protein
MDLPEGLTGPNDGAYTKIETREGPPLEYVGEKLHSCLVSLHTLHTAAREDLPDDLPKPRRMQHLSYEYNPKVSSVLLPCHHAFRQALVSYLALNNLLAIANDNDLTESLLAMSHDDFANWLNRIRDEGSVT